MRFNDLPPEERHRLAAGRMSLIDRLPKSVRRHIHEHGCRPAIAYALYRQTRSAKKTIAAMEARQVEVEKKYAAYLAAGCPVPAYEKAAKWTLDRHAELMLAAVEGRG